MGVGGVDVTAWPSLVVLAALAVAFVALVWELRDQRRARLARAWRRDQRSLLRVASVMGTGQRRRPRVDPRVQRNRSLR